MQWRARRVRPHGESMQVRRGSIAAESACGRGQGKSHLTEIKFVTRRRHSDDITRSICRRDHGGGHHAEV